MSFVATSKMKLNIQVCKEESLKNFTKEKKGCIRTKSAKQR